MAAEPVSRQELVLLHERIGWAMAELRFRARGRRAAPGVPDELFRVAEEAVCAFRVAPRLAVGLGAALLVVAGVAAVLVARRRF